MRLIDADSLREIWLASDDFDNDTINAVLYSIDEAPTVDAEPVRHGRWIDTEPEYCDCYAKNAHVCSNCHDFYTLDWEYMNYCPNCGAKREKGER